MGMILSAGLAKHRKPIMDMMIQELNAKGITNWHGVKLEQLDYGALLQCYTVERIRGEDK